MALNERICQDLMVVLGVTASSLLNFLSSYSFSYLITYLDIHCLKIHLILTLAWVDMDSMGSWIPRDSNWGQSKMR